MRDKVYKFRLLFFFSFFVALTAVLGVRLYYLQIIKHDYYKTKAKDQQNKIVELTPLRGDIVDRNGVVLATSTFMDSVYVEPDNIPAGKKKPLARDLAKVLSSDNFDDNESCYQNILKVLEKKGAGAYPLARKIGRDKVNQIQAIKIDYGLERYALYFRKENKRHYPRKTLCASVLGYTTIDNSGDNEGLTGIEKQYDEFLKGTYTSVEVHRNAAQENLEPIESNAISDSRGNTVVLTIDSTIQAIAERELSRMIELREADSGAAVVMEADTGEVLALASIPTFDPNEYTEYPQYTHRNRAITGPIETGSVMKTITFSTLIDCNVVGLNEIVDCQNGYAVIDGRPWSDAGGHVLERVPLEEVFVWSSNVGTVKLSKKLHEEEVYEYLTRFGFGQPTGIDLPIEDKGILRGMERWTRGSVASISVGYEVAVTPIQIAAALAAIANDGVRVKPHVVKTVKTSMSKPVETFESEEVRRVVKSSTAHIMLEFLEAAVQRGTGRAAYIEGYRIGGKTGTTLKSDREREYIASFAGVVPVDDPKIVIYLYVDNPKKKHYAAEVAAPVFHAICDQTLKYMNIPPSDTGVMFAEEESAKPSARKAESVERKKPVQGVMPDLRGLTMREAIVQLADYRFSDVRFVGSGVVTEQKPEPETKVNGTERCMVFFN